MNASVVMAVRNGERHLAEAIASIHAQTVAPLEILLVDGGSHDATRAIAEAHGARVIQQRGDTLADAYNTGIEAARGDVVAFLSYDDVWLPRKLELQLERLRTADACVCHAELFLDGPPPPGFRPELLDGPRPVRVMEALAARRELFARVGGLRADVSPADDTDWFARAADLGHEVAVLPETLLRKRVHAGSTAHDGSAAALPRLLRASIERKRAQVAIVVPVRDGERYLEAALRSLLEQTRPPDDLVVADDGSRDGSAAVAEALGVRVLRGPAAGAAAARNAGVRATTAGLVGFLDADDLAEPRRLELQVAALAPGVDAVLGHCVNFAEAGAERYRFVHGPHPGYNPGSLLIRRAAFDAIGGFDESLPAGEVVDFFARTSVLRTRVIDDVVLRRRVHGGNTTLHDPALHAGYLEAARRAIARKRA
jgi:glycosyltransferase involved in cell wall biosynthesis